MCQPCYNRWYASDPERNARRKATRLDWHYNNHEWSLLSSRTWKENNEDKVKQYNQEHAVERRAYTETRRARLLGVDEALTPKEWRQILSEYNYECAYCCKSFDRLEQDHVIPLSRGGTHTRDNVVPACLPCNREKATSLVTPKHKSWHPPTGQNKGPVGPG